eukprot:1057126-Amphidinium_carterae.1
MRRGKRLNHAGLNMGSFVRAGAVSQTTWGSATNGTTGLQVRQLRARVLRAVKRIPMQASAGWCFSVFPELGAIDPAAELHVRALVCWIQVCLNQLVPYEEMDLALCAAAHRLQGAAAPWLRVHGPAAATLLCCARI